MEEYKEGVLQYYKNGEIKRSKDRDTNSFLSLLMFAISCSFVLFLVVSFVLLFKIKYSIF